MTYHPPDTPNKNLTLTSPFEVSFGQVLLKQKSEYQQAIHAPISVR